MKYEKYKSQLPYSYTLGITLTIELLKKHPESVLDIYYHSSFSGESKDLIDNLARNCKITPTQNDKIFNIVSQKENVYCIGVFKKFNSPISKDSDHVVLVNPSNAGNLGTIIRTSVGFNLNNLIIIKPAVDIFDPKAVRASMGALFNLNFALYDSFDDYKKEYNHNFYPFTDTDDIYHSEAGIPSYLVSIPLRYMHSSVELCDLKDSEEIIELLTEFICELEEDTSFDPFK